MSSCSNIRWPAAFPWAGSSLSSSLLFAFLFLGLLARLLVSSCSNIRWSAACTFPWAGSSFSSSLLFALLFLRLPACLHGSIWTRPSLACTFLFAVFLLLALGLLFLLMLLFSFFLPAVLVAAPSTAFATPGANAAALTGRHGGDEAPEAKEMQYFIELQGPETRQACDEGLWLERFCFAP